MNVDFRQYGLPLILFALSGCATQGKPPPAISLDEPVQAQVLTEPPTPIEVVAVPEPLPLPAQLKPLLGMEDVKPVPEPADERGPGAGAKQAARIARTLEGNLNRIHDSPFTDGAVDQRYDA